MSIIRAEERDPEVLLRLLSDRETVPVHANLVNAIVALSGIVVDQQRKILRLSGRMNSVVIYEQEDRKATAKRFFEVEKRINDMGFPT